MKLAKVSKKAVRDLDRIWDLNAADRVWDAVLDVADLLAEHPEAGKEIRNASPRHATVRWFVVPKFRNYLIFYRPDENGILVIRILHAAQDWTRSFS